MIKSNSPIQVLHAIFWFLLSVSSVFAQELKVIKYPDLAKIIAQEDSPIKVINFWATWCKPCVKELPQFEALNEKYKSEGLKLILVSLDFAEEADTRVKQFVDKKNLKSSLYLLDETDYNSFIDKIDPRWSGAIPATLMIDYRNDKRDFYEKEFKEEELEKTYLKFIN